MIALVHHTATVQRPCSRPGFCSINEDIKTSFLCEHGIIPIPLPYYRVINKEGQKVLGYETIKKCAFEATKRLIASKNMGHFDIQSSFILRLA